MNQKEIEAGWSQQQKVLAMMCRGENNQWWHAYDYIGWIHGLFVGHRAPARISELGREYPELIETIKDPDKPRLHQYRLRFDNFHQFRHTLPDDLKSVILSEMVRSGRLKGDRF